MQVKMVFQNLTSFFHLYTLISSHHPYNFVSKYDHLRTELNTQPHFALQLILPEMQYIMENINHIGNFMLQIKFALALVAMLKLR